MGKDKNLEGLLQRVAVPSVLRGFSSPAAANQAFDVRWRDGHITRIEPVAGAPEGTLLSAPVDVHVHIDKNYTVDEVGEARGDLGAAIARMKASRPGWTADQLRTRMTRALEDAWRCGTRALRTHIDWPDPLPPPSLPVLLELREAWSDRITLQFAALTPLDAFDAQGSAAERVRLLAELGGVLGCYAFRNADLASKLRRAFALAADSGV